MSVHLQFLLWLQIIMGMPFTVAEMLMIRSRRKGETAYQFCTTLRRTNGPLVARNYSCMCSTLQGTSCLVFIFHTTHPVTDARRNSDIRPLGPIKYVLIFNRARHVKTATQTSKTNQVGRDSAKVEQQKSLLLGGHASRHHWSSQKSNGQAQGKFWTRMYTHPLRESLVPNIWSLW